jgi:hypothetical protein
MNRTVFRLSTVVVALGMAISVAGWTPAGAQSYRLRGISPIFDGWETLPDGSRLFYFGYINRNPDPLTIPIGAANNFEPAPADKNQPTFFLPGRHEHVFTVKPPPNFKGKMVWTLNSEMGVQTANASFDQLYILEERENEDPNAKPPAVAIADLTVKAGDMAALAPRVTPAAASRQVVVEGAANEAAGLTVNWMKYRGPGNVTLAAVRTSEPARSTSPAGRGRGRGAASSSASPGATLTLSCGAKPAPGCGAATASFSEPGAYVLRVAARQDGLQGIAFVKVTVQP